MAIWWIGEPIPLGITALLPVILFPLSDIMNTKEITPLYGNHIIFLFLGGFLVAYSMEKWHLHKRIALAIIKKTGTTPHRIVLGFMLSSYLLSMWISNTATTMMLIPPALATISQLETLNDKLSNRFQIILLLSIAYSSSIGGISTLVGTPPNLIFYNFYSTYLSDSFQITFLNWMIFALPTSFTFFVIVYIYFKYLLRKETTKIPTNSIKDAYNELGTITAEQKRIGVVFVLLAISWITRKDIELGNFLTIPGWNSLFNKDIGDSSVAILFALLLFVMPSSKKGIPLLSLSELKKIPLNILLLFGGGFALAHGVIQSGLGTYLAEQLHFLQGMPTLLLVGLICLFLLFLTEVSSNSAAINLALPILLALSLELHLPAWMILIPSTLACSFAFMLPISTPPNAIIFESGKIKVKEMMRYGFVLNLIGIIVLLLATFTIGNWVFGI